MNLFEKYSSYEYSILKFENWSKIFVDDIYELLLGRGYSCSYLGKLEEDTEKPDDIVRNCSCSCICSSSVNCSCETLEVPVLRPCFDCCNSEKDMPRGDWCQNCKSRCPYKPYRRVLVQLQRSNIDDPDDGWCGNPEYYFKDFQVRNQELIKEGKLRLECRKSICPPSSGECPCPEPIPEELCSKYILIFDIENKKNTLEDLKKISSKYGEYKCIYDMKYILLPDCLSKEVGSIYYEEDDVIDIDGIKIKYNDSENFDKICDISVMSLDEIKYLKDKAERFFG